MQTLRSLFLVAAVFLAAVPFTAAWAGEPQLPTYHLRVDGLACPFCAYGIEKRLMSMIEVTRIEVDIGAGEMTVHVEEGVVLEEAVAHRAVTSAGFTLQSFWVEGAAE